jgi:chromosome segregation ATPase
MNKNGNKVSVARLEERIINMQETLKELKEMVSNIKGCVDTNEKEVNEIKGKFSSHLDEHKSDLVKLGIFISVVVIIINIALRII